MFAGGLDVGTTGCKIVIYDENAQLLDTYYKEYDSVHKNGLHEIDFCNIKDGVFSILKSATEKYKLSALGVTSFGETFAMLDENDHVLAPSMLYTDPRGAVQCKELTEKLGEDKLTKITGVKPDPMYSIAKMMWLRNNNSDAFKKCKRILLGEDFIVYTLTGVAQIDYSLAARTAAFDIKQKKWCKEIFDAADVDCNLLSAPVKTGTVAGKLKPEIKEMLGINYDITVVNGCHDQVAGMIGAGVFEKQQAMDGTGTVECMPVILDSVPDDPKIFDGGYSVVPYINETYACYALSFTGGATLKWFRDNFAEVEKQQETETGKNAYETLDSAVSNEPTGILCLPHFAGAATPYMDSDSKAAFIGITLETTKYDIYKALMEGTSYEMLLNFNTLKSVTGEINEIKATGGGAFSDVWLQIKADILGADISALTCKQVGAAGVAALAGYAIGMYTDLKTTVEKMSTVRKVFKPDAARHEKYSKLYSHYENIYNSIKKI